MDVGFPSLPDLSTPLFGSSGSKSKSKDSPVEEDHSKPVGNGHADSMSDSSDSSSHSNSDSDAEDVKNKNNSSSEEETELPKQLQTSDDDEDDDEDDKKSKDSGSDDEDDSKKNDSESDSEDKKDSNSDGQSSNDEDGGEKSSGKSRKENLQRVLFDTDSQDTGDNDASRGGSGRRVTAIRELKDEWDQKPDLYGIRRSGRSRREVVRYNAGNNSGSDSDRKKKRSRRRESEDWKSQEDEDNSEEASSDSEDFRPAKSKRAKPPPRPKRSARAAPKSRGRTKNLSSSESSEDSDSYSRPVPQRKTAQKVRHKYRPTRHKASKKAVSYKEDTDEATDSDDIIEAATPVAEVEEDNRETIEKVLDGRRGRKGATGHKTTLYNVRENRDPNTTPLKEGEKEEFEKHYLIKWKGWSHIHNTWEAEASLREQKVNGMKKFENFLKREEEIRDWKASASPEDCEYYDCQQEMMQDLIESHKTVERIIAHRKENNGNSDYLCKWQGLPYSDCTWEDGDLISKLFQSHIDKYLARNKSQCIPTKLSRVLKARPKFVPLKSQPAHLGGSDNLALRDYQLDGLNWMVHSWCKENSVILADEMGLGKTIQIISFISHMYNQYQLYGPFLLVVPLSTVVAWQREFDKWAPEMNVIIYMGDVGSRSMLREQEWRHPGNKRLKFNALITTYEILLKDKSFLGAESWAFLGVDEAHRLKNDDSLLYRSLEGFDTNHRILITGTPLQNSLKELWSLLHFIMPSKFDSWPDFEAKHSKEEGKGFISLHKQLEPYLLRRVKKDVEKSLPAKTERILRVELSSLQKTYYKAILKREFRTLMKGMRGNVSSYANIMMELKKCANHAHLVVPLEEEPALKERLQTLLKGSGKLLLLDKLLVRLKETGHRVLIFSQMVRMLDIVADYLQCRHFNYQRLDGTIRGDLRKQALDHFNAEGSQDFCFLLSTRAGGLGVNLATADTVIIFDSDWNPQNDLQAQARAHRIGQTKQVSVYRLVTSSTVEEKIVESAKKKMVLDHLVIQRMDTTGRTVLDRGSAPSSATPFSKDELCAILKFGAEELFKGTENEDEEEQQVDIDDILNRAEEHETEAHGVGDELLSQFKVASFGNLEEEAETSRASFGEEEEKDWEDIIPEDVRQKMEEEERQQQLLDLELGPRNRKTIKQLQVDYDSDKDKKKRKGKKESDSDASDEEDDDDDDDQPKKRGRPKGASKDGIRGFSNAEIRRFVRSYKKFAAPLKRLDAIAEDAELQEKSEAELKRLIEHLKKSCEEAMKDHAQKLLENPSLEGAKKTHKGPSFKINSVSINAQSMLKAEEDLKPLAEAIPDDREQRKKWRLDHQVKKVHWDCFWNIDDDSSLLKGIYEYGMGSYEAIKMDESLGLSDRILPDGELKPQAKHLQTRVDFLLKILKGKDATPTPNVNKIVKARKRNPKSKAEVIDKDDSSSSDEGKEKKPQVVDAPSKKKQPPVEKEIKKENDLSDISDSELDTDDESKPKPKANKAKPKKPKKEVKEEKKEKEKPVKAKSKNKKKLSGPMHFTASSAPKEIGEEEEEEERKNMDPKTFEECKEKMRPMKKVLKQLSEPDESLNEKEQVSFIRSILLKIGDHISSSIEELSDPEKIKFWRDKLWLFVSNFTTLNHKKLRKLYKGACKKRDDDRLKDKKGKDNGTDSRQKNNALKRAHDKSDKEGSSSKKHQSAGRNDRSHHHQPHHKDSHVNSNHKGQHQRGPGSHHSQFRSGVPTKDALTSDLSVSSSGSPGNNWTLASPLSRTEDVSRSRYDSSSHMYNRHPHSHPNPYSSHHESHRTDRADSKDSYYRFNDRQGPGGQHYHRDYRGRNEHRAGYRPDPHRGDHYRPEYGNHYRDQGMSQQQHYSRDRASDDWGTNSHHSYSGDRKRRNNDDFHDWERRQKDPRMDMKTRYPPGQPPPPGDSPSFSHH
ncbi:chromodomain-helicase-DNA-binding protein 1 isoform X2 [Aplysia californica]|uniref:Chromodomain-helicase-DNA-binding protein 1 isoform X2 n=1 Tax=Aplysia californica TaxID=6500 RepID=A0ABM0JX75_APLCA|nr:chromodomain-helicase-DNA-binding protein 1 isoform X2 [Aplysia californica]